MEKESALLEICKLITDNDSDVMTEMKQCIDNIEAYVETHLEEYDGRGMSLEDDSVEDFQWVGMANCLIRNHYAEEFDWKVDLTDFGWGIKELKKFKEFGLSLDKQFLDDDYSIDRYDKYNSYDTNEDDMYDYEQVEALMEEDIESWSKYLDNSWADDDICLGRIDVESDSYVVFLTKTETLEKLTDIAYAIDRHITTVY